MSETERTSRIEESEWINEQGSLCVMEGRRVYVYYADHDQRYPPRDRMDFPDEVMLYKGDPNPIKREKNYAELTLDYVQSVKRGREGNLAWYYLLAKDIPIEEAYMASC